MGIEEESTTNTTRESSSSSSRDEDGLASEQELAGICYQRNTCALIAPLSRTFNAFRPLPRQPGHAPVFFSIVLCRSFTC